MEQAVLDRLTSTSKATEVKLANGEVANVLWVTVEGPIGAGKTELMNILNKRLSEEFGFNRVFYVAEPIDALMQSGLFQRYQKDPSRWAYEFQTEMFDKRTDYWLAAWHLMLRMLMDTPCRQDGRHGLGGRKLAIMLSERSILSDTCFMHVQHEYGHCDEDTLKRYLSLNAKWRSLYKGCVPGLVVYCRAGTETESIVDLCQQRIKNRQREDEEKLVTPAYNRKVLQAHDALFGAENGMVLLPADIDHPWARIPVLTVDTTENYRDDPRVALKKSSEVLDRIRLAVDTPSPPPPQEEEVKLDEDAMFHVMHIGDVGPIGGHGSHPLVPVTGPDIALCTGCETCSGSQ
jgi:deoxyadenosine/deoxycytidine kinase